MIDINKLKSLGSEKVITFGINKIPELSKTRMIKWVAVTGEANDWALYATAEDWSLTRVMTNGDKLKDKNLIKRLVDCDDEVMKAYRF